MNQDWVIYLFYGAVSLVVVILVIMFFQALHAITRIEVTLRGMLKLFEEQEKRTAEKEYKRLP